MGRANLPTSDNSARRGAVVVGGGGHGALAIVRSLGRRGIPVWLLVDELRVATSSRYLRGWSRWPASLPPEQQTEYLLDTAHRNHLEGWTLIPGSEQTPELIASQREALGPIFRLATSSVEAVRDALDKRRSYALADRCGVDHPRTFYPESIAELMRLEVRFPAILKPSIKAGWNALIGAKAWKVNDREDLLGRYREAQAMMEPRTIMLQDFIPGGNENQYSYAALCRDGTPLASLVARRLRQYPIEFGRSSSLVETLDLPDVETAAQRLLRDMNFTGIVEVEFKRDPRDDKLRLLDINPRVWRWMSLGRRVGVDFPYLLYRMSRSEPIDPVKAIAGVRWVRMSTDLFAAASEMLRGTTTVRAYLDSLCAPLEFASFAFDDPLPALLEMPLLLASEVRHSRLGRALRMRH